eukprot:33431-Eustigmatos_ZCMA.PRE.1
MSPGDLPPERSVNHTREYCDITTWGLVGQVDAELPLHCGADMAGIDVMPTARRLATSNVPS